MLCIYLSILFAAFAWLISWGMVVMLFYPKKPIQLLGFYWEAPFLKWAKIIDWNAVIPAENLPKQLDHLMPIIDSKLDDFFRNRLAEKLPMIAMFIGDKTIQQLKQVFIEELQNMFPDLIHSFSKNMQQTIIAELEHKSLQIIEKMILDATAPIRKLAIILGFAWGCISYLIWSIF